jgi:hypothetical protein
LLQADRAGSLDVRTAQLLGGPIIPKSFERSFRLAGGGLREELVQRRHRPQPRDCSSGCLATYDQDQSQCESAYGYSINQASIASSVALDICQNLYEGQTIKCDIDARAQTQEAQYIWNACVAAASIAYAICIYETAGACALGEQAYRAALAACTAAYFAKISAINSNHSACVQKAGVDLGTCQANASEVYGASINSAVSVRNSCYATAESKYAACGMSCGK